MTRAEAIAVLRSREIAFKIKLARKAMKQRLYRCTRRRGHPDAVCFAVAEFVEFTRRGTIVSCRECVRSGQAYATIPHGVRS